MRAQTVVSLAALFGATLIPAFASAHIGLSAPTARAQAPNQGNVKSAPCGQTTDGRTSGVTVFQPGQVITVSWVEYVNHPSYFRVAFQQDGDSFPMRMNVPQSNSVPETADQQQSAEEAVFSGSTAQLLAVVQDNNTSTTATLSTQVTLPSTPCENCTLQVVQVMYNNPPQDGGGYYQCADIAIRSGGATTSGDDNGNGGNGNGNGDGTTGSAGEAPGGEPDAGTGSQQNGNVSGTAAPGAGTSNAGSGTKSVGAGANGEGSSTAPAATTPAGATSSATTNTAETAMGVAAGSTPSNSATPAASAPFGSGLTPESSGGGGGGCSLGMRTSGGAGASIAILAGLAWVTRRRRAR